MTITDEFFRVILSGSKHEFGQLEIDCKTLSAKIQSASSELIDNHNKTDPWNPARVVVDRYLAAGTDSYKYIILAVNSNSQVRNMFMKGLENMGYTVDLDHKAKSTKQ
ncbi:hypothetical protein G3495_20775 [Shewanella baltica]|uniref:hypothetical protein n=1 Tax=Shewanella TaxID=22 RepID=UPI00217E7A96|nr:MULTISPECIES: hypothetical protein [Shewanella]MCS6237522.1 hypothetical protein [Shewanella baltica]MCS6272099.1 hypothetical protein [Shewanella baltica]MCU8085312.1 hypothetical protein [Shewanella sp. SM23]